MTLGRIQAAWLTRLLLAILLFFGSEVLLWTHLLDYSLVDLLVRIIGYGALSVFVLDIAVRYRIRDVYDAMVVFALYGLLASLLVTPTISYENFPRSILTRVLGGHTLVGFEVWGLFLVLLAGKNQRYKLLMLGATLWLGFYWGIWMRWIPEFGTLFEAISLQTMFIIPVIFLALVMLVYLVLTRSKISLEPQDFQLSRVHWGILFAILLILFLYQFYFVDISIWPVVVTALIMLVCWSILWFRREETGETLLDKHFPIMSISPLWLILALGVFAASTLFAYYLPLVGTREINQLWLMELGFAAVGTIWLPLVAINLAVRGIDYQMRTNQML